jgi:hypothetical protein
MRNFDDPGFQQFMDDTQQDEEPRLIHPCVPFCSKCFKNSGMSTSHKEASPCCQADVILGADLISNPAYVCEHIEKVGRRPETWEA